MALGRDYDAAERRGKRSPRGAVVAGQVVRKYLRTEVRAPWNGARDLSRRNVRCERLRRIREPVCQAAVLRTEVRAPPWNGARDLSRRKLRIAELLRKVLKPVCVAAFRRTEVRAPREVHGKRPVPC